MTYQKIVSEITSMYEKAEYENASVEAENLVIEVLDIRRSEFYMRKIMQMSPSKEEVKKVSK